MTDKKSKRIKSSDGKNIRPKKIKKKMSKKKKIIITCLIVFVVLLISFGILLFDYLFGGLNQTELTEDFSRLGIDSSHDEKFTGAGIVNIALFGVDSRNNTFTGLSDTIIIASINRETGVVKLTAIARDTWVPVDGHGNQKINAAYSKGGPELAIKTLNQNFGMNIKDYVTINMTQLVKVIDVAGGVTIEISEAERQMANGIMNELTSNAPKIKQAGKVTLTGAQATAYCRIRYIDSDFQRMERQRIVLEELFNKAKTLSLPKLAETIHTISPMVETSMDYDEIYELAKVLTISGARMESLKYPHENTKFNVGPSNNQYIEYDLVQVKRELYDFIYNNKRPDIKQ